MTRIINTTVTVENPYTGKEVEVEVTIRVDHDPGVHTYRNGDPGYPPSTDITLVNWQKKPGMEWLNEELLWDEVDKIDESELIE